MRVPLDQRVPEPSTFKVIFGWRAWLLLALLLGGWLGNDIPHQRTIQDFQTEINDLQTEFRQMEAQMDYLQREIAQDTSEVPQ